MNICLVLISDGWGGAEAVVYELARHLRDKGENVSIVLNQEIFKFYKDLEDVEVFNIGSVYNTKILIKSILKTETNVSANFIQFVSTPFNYYINYILRYIFYKKITKQIGKILLKHNIDVVHLHLEESFRLFTQCIKQFRIPTILTIHGEYREVFSTRTLNPLNISKKVAISKALAKADEITFVSEKSLNTFENYGISCQCKSTVVPNGVDILYIQKNSENINLEGNFKLLYAGGARYKKGGDLAIKSLFILKKIIPGIRLYFLGTISENHLIRKLVKDLELEEQVFFKGFVPPPQFYQYLNSTDLLIVPSRWEGFGIILLEAMALGKPIVATEVGGIPEVIKNGRNGILVEPVASKIADAVLYLYRNEDVRNKIRSNNVEDVKKFDWSLIVDEYIDAYGKTGMEKG